MQEPFHSIAEVRDAGRRFTEAAFGLLALASLAFGLVVHAGLLPLRIAPEAQTIIAWSFVGLATVDAALLVVWHRVIAWIWR